MSASGYTPILLYGSTTASAVPLAANLTTSASGVELAINAYDGKLFYKDAGGTVQVLGVKMPSGILPIANGGTNSSATPTAGAIAYGTGTAYGFTAAGSSGQVLTSAGSGTPTWTSLSSIGVTTFSAGTTGFTPNTATSGAVTLAGTLATTNGGTGLTSFTANGVVYASSTSALTTGSALTFDGTNFATTGNMSVPIAKSYYCYTTDYGVGTPDSLGLQLFYGAGDSMRFGSRSSGTFSEQMRLTSTGLGIGTSSPITKLSNTGNTWSGGIATDGFAWRSTQNDWTAAVLATPATGAGYGLRVHTLGATASDVPLMVSSGAGSGSALLLLNGSGNLGLGVTPSGWASSFKVIQIGASGGALNSYSGSGAINMAVNNYYDGTVTPRYVTTNYALYYQQNPNTGQHLWYNAPSGTAGTAITFTQAMTLDASGNLVVGGTSANRKLEIVEASNNYQMRLGAGSVSSSYTYDIGRSNVDGYLYFYGNQSGANGYVFSGVNGERARIDSSGNFLIGATSVGSGYGHNLITGNDAKHDIFHYASASGTVFAGFIYNANGIGSITQSGTTAVLYNVTSDQRLKENIVDAAPVSDLIDSLQVRQFDWKSDGTHQRYGFVAQELVEVAPEAVHQPADPEEMMAVDYSKLVPMLVKEIQSLRARLTAAGIA